MGIVLAPSVKLKNWNFDAELAESGYKWQNNPTYFINYVQGLTGAPFEFWIDLEVRDTYISVIWSLYEPNTLIVGCHARSQLSLYMDS